MKASKYAYMTWMGTRSQQKGTFWRVDLMMFTCIGVFETCFTDTITITTHDTSCGPDEMCVDEDVCGIGAGARRGHDHGIWDMGGT